jgi:hypothetical protein
MDTAPESRPSVPRRGTGCLDLFVSVAHGLDTSGFGEVAIRTADGIGVCPEAQGFDFGAGLRHRLINPAAIPRRRRGLGGRQTT